MPSTLAGMMRYVDYPCKDSGGNLMPIITYGLLIGFRTWITTQVSHLRATLCGYVDQAFQRIRRPFDSQHLSPALSGFDGKASPWCKVARSLPSCDGQKSFIFQLRERGNCASDDNQEAVKVK